MDIAQLKRYAAEPMSFIDDARLVLGGQTRRFGDCLAEFQRARFADLMPALLSVARGQTPVAPRHWWEATKGCSKDSDLALALLWLLAFSPRLLHCQVGAADRDQANELRRAAMQWLASNPWLGELVEIQTWSIVNKTTGSSCEIVPADVAGSHGSRPDVLVLNELHAISRQDFASNLMDNATKVPGGVAIIATNAGILDTWQHEWRELARTSPRWKYHEYNQPAPWLSEDEIAEARRRNPPHRFNRLFGGVWSSGTGDAIAPDDIEQCVILPGPLPGRYGELYTFGALDLGLKNDRTAVAVLAADPFTGQVRLAECKSWSPREHGGTVDLAIVERDLIAMYDRLKIQSLLFDPWQAQYLASRLRSVGCNMIEYGFSPAAADQMARAVMSAFKNREVQLYRDTELIRDLCSMSIVEKPSTGQFKLVATRDARGHADKGFAFAMALANVSDFIESCRGHIENGGLFVGGRLATNGRDLPSIHNSGELLAC